PMAPTMHRFLLTLAILFVFLSHSQAEDPLAPVLEPHLQPAIDVFLNHYSTGRKYVNSDFPLTKHRFTAFKEEIASALARTLEMESWVVRGSEEKKSELARRFKTRLVKTLTLHGVSVELHVVRLEPTGLEVPMALCLPAELVDLPVPGVCVFSGHTNHGLHDLVVDLDSYQQGLAIRLAQAGLVSIAVEKIDAGYLSRQGSDGNDEQAAATLMLSWGSYLRSHQLRACLAATEILANHPRVDETRIGAAGVSLGGWLAVQTAMLNQRIVAVADFGRKTRSVPMDQQPEQYRGQSDLCHILPGMLRLSDRNLLPVALAPLPMLAGHGRQDQGSHAQHDANFLTIGQAQYAKLGAAANYTYHVHEGGDSMPSQVAIDWFQQQFREEPKQSAPMP
ncbi:MAG: dienelactone hydrolase family protein, partial [Bythopirellula sp.]